MQKPSIYLMRATEALRLARKARTSEERNAFEEIAAAWRQLELQRVETERLRDLVDATAGDLVR